MSSIKLIANAKLSGGALAKIRWSVELGQHLHLRQKLVIFCMGTNPEPHDPAFTTLTQGTVSNPCRCEPSKLEGWNVLA